MEVLFQAAENLATMHGYDKTKIQDIKKTFNEEIDALMQKAINGSLNKDEQKTVNAFKEVFVIEIKEKVNLLNINKISYF